MKKLILGIVFSLVLMLGDCSRVQAAYEPVEPYAYFYPQLIRCTLYCEHHKTADGTWPYYGIAAGRKEWHGYVAQLNAVNEDGSVGEFIGFFEFRDTESGFDSDGDGKGDSLKNGSSIDIWVESRKEMKAWQKKYGDYVYIKLIKADG